MRKTFKYCVAMENKYIIDLLVEHKPEVGRVILKRWSNLSYKETKESQFVKSLEQGRELLKKFNIPYSPKHLGN